MILNNRLAVFDEKITERELNARKFVRKAAAEGAVLLKNDRTLPLGKSIRKIALFGAGASQTIRGGTGSGDVNIRSYVTVREGLSDAGYEIVTDRLLKRYDCEVSAAKALFKSHIQQKAADGVKNALIEMMHHPFTARNSYVRKVLKDMKRMPQYMCSPAYPARAQTEKLSPPIICSAKRSFAT